MLDLDQTEFPDEIYAALGFYLCTFAICESILFSVVVEFAKFAQETTPIRGEITMNGLLNRLEKLMAKSKLSKSAEKLLGYSIKHLKVLTEVRNTMFHNGVCQSSALGFATSNEGRFKNKADQLKFDVSIERLKEMSLDLHRLSKIFIHLEYPDHRWKEHTTFHAGFARPWEYAP